MVAASFADLLAHVASRAAHSGAQSTRARRGARCPTAVGACSGGVPTTSGAAEADGREANSLLRSGGGVATCCNSGQGSATCRADGGARRKSFCRAAVAGVPDVSDWPSEEAGPWRRPPDGATCARGPERRQLPPGPDLCTQSLLAAAGVASAQVLPRGMGSDRYPAAAPSTAPPSTAPPACDVSPNGSGPLPAAHEPPATSQVSLGGGLEKSYHWPDAGAPLARRLRVAVDVDEVLGSFLATLNVFCQEEYRISHDVSEFFVYDFMKIWKCSQAEANHRVHQFFESEHFNEGIPPIPGAFEALQRLSGYCHLSVVTSRQHVIRAPTLEWIKRHFPGIFEDVHFGNHFALSGAARPKSEICKELGLEVLIDDNPRYALECAEHGIRVLLFDWNLSYPWSKTADGPEHPLITRVKDWDDVEHAMRLLALVCR